MHILNVYVFLLLKTTVSGKSLCQEKAGTTTNALLTPPLNSVYSLKPFHSTDDNPACSP